ncbi:RNA polymerase subunit sigma-70 [Bacillus sp. DX4.1]|uniref:RNA polymerase subunit sigma-70 n=1 Tax=Bacillus sp. DX4.1 TaxID=3055867 RepID=UPI0025A152B6|nr:RNA polymerase subunit sigma-70 [Bacillus sp. DX4.1]MDM5188672.1 RNA polymerase subunit sigma-70 [Bacillus sp. DX4.1]
MCTKVKKFLESHVDMNHSNINFLIEHYAELKRYCTFLTKDKWDGEDLAQETICKVLQKYVHKIEVRDICITLLYKVARNQWLDQIKAKSSQVKIEPLLYEEPHEKIADLHEMVEKVLSSLNVQQSVIFILKEVFQYSLSDIAKVCSISEGAVKASLFRSRNKIKKINDEDVFEVADQEGEVEIIVTAIQQQRPELLTKLLPTLQFTHFSFQQPVLLFNKKMSSSHGYMLCAA